MCKCCKPVISRVPQGQSGSMEFIAELEAVEEIQMNWAEFLWEKIGTVVCVWGSFPSPEQLKGNVSRGLVRLGAGSEKPGAGLDSSC